MLQKNKSKQELIFGGDLNARVSSSTQNIVLGPHGEKVINNSGERLIILCELHGLKITITLFAHKSKYKYNRDRPSLIHYRLRDYQTGHLVLS